MKLIRIPKRNGTFRTIYVPSKPEKAACRCWLEDVAGAARMADLRDVMHGFTAGRSPVTNATAHRARHYSLCFDLENFFDSVTRAHIQEPLFAQQDFTDTCFVDGAARQGLPTSPAIANLAAAPMDNEIISLRSAGRFGSFVYTRYADDLTFSFDLESIGLMLQRQIPVIARRHGFRINESKTRWQCSVAGARHITGIAVASASIRPTREVKRRLRAAEHALKTGNIGRRTLLKLMTKHRGRDTKRSFRTLLKAQAEGLAEWIKLKPPKAITALPESVRRTPQCSLPKAVKVTLRRKLDIP